MRSDDSFVEVKCPECHTARAVFADDTGPLKCYSCGMDLSDVASEPLSSPATVSKIPGEVTPSMRISPSQKKLLILAVLSLTVAFYAGKSWTFDHEVWEAVGRPQFNGFTTPEMARDQIVMDQWFDVMVNGSALGGLLLFSLLLSRKIPRVAFGLLMAAGGWYMAACVRGFYLIGTLQVPETLRGEVSTAFQAGYLAVVGPKAGAYLIVGWLVLAFSAPGLNAARKLARSAEKPSLSIM